MSADEDYSSPKLANGATRRQGRHNLTKQLRSVPRDTNSRSGLTSKGQYFF
jgi:hypothetical protein